MKGDDYYSEKFLYYVARRHILNLSQLKIDRGATLLAVIEAAKRYGVLQESLFRFDYVLDDEPPPNVYANALLHQALLSHQINEHRDGILVLEEIKRFLCQEYPVVCGFRCYDGIDSEETKQTGIVLPQLNNSKSVGGHAIMLIGYCDAPELLMFKNSWDVDWGKKGLGFLPYSYVLNKDVSDIHVLYATEAGSNCDIVKLS